MSRGRTYSFEKFNYVLRPNKQVERKLLIEALQVLRSEDYNIGDYTYIGFGSIYYADFILFHKYLLIDKMICIEGESIKKRMEFNKPYDFIDLRIGALSKHIPELKKDRYFAWLDYDTGLNADKLDDISGILARLNPGSIFLVTIDAEAKIRNAACDVSSLSDDELESRSYAQERLFEFYSEEFSHLLLEGIHKSDVSTNGFPTLLVRILQSHVASALSETTDMKFLQLFNFEYADKARMLTFGGLVDLPDRFGKGSVMNTLSLSFINSEVTPRKISVPPLTLREKLWLDQLMPGSIPDDDDGFGLDQKVINQYREFYRHYPVYHETIL